MTNVAQFIADEPYDRRMRLHVATFAELDPRTLYAVLRLRCEVFVVEQHCAYPDIDGRDQEPATRHLWLAPEDDPTDVRTYLRVLTEPDGSRRIGRVCTATANRRQGWSAQLMTAALDLVDEVPAVAVLDAQSHVLAFYERFGFVVNGPEYLDDGIPHAPMRRSSIHP